MRSAFFRLLLASLVLACAAVQAADRRETRPVTAFTALSLAAPIDVELVQGDHEPLVLEGPEDVVAAIETTVEGATLRIHMKPAFSWSRGRVKAKVTARTIEAMRISGAGDIAAAALKVPTLRLEIVGSGDIRIGRLEATKLDAAISGSGDVQVGGRVDAFAVRIEGSGDVKAEGLEAREVRVSIAGSGDARVWAREALSAAIAGSGDVRYRGDPKVERSVAGSGSVARLRG